MGWRSDAEDAYERGGIQAVAAMFGEGAEDEYAVSITINVTARDFDNAVELALEDLRDPDLDWTDFDVQNSRTGEARAVKRGVA